MAVYFVQHGIALAKDVDPSRPLSEAGREESVQISSYLHKLGINVNKIYHSGKTRARETAQIFSRQLGDIDIQDLTGMNPNDDATAFASELDEDDVMYIGHLPHMGKVVSYLTAGDEGAGVVRFVNSGVICLEKDNETYHIEWYLKPSMCERR